MPKRSRNGAVSIPARVVAPISVNGGRSNVIERAAGPSPIIMWSWESSIAGYNTSSTVGDSRWISSTNSTSFGCRLVKRGEVAGAFQHRAGGGAQAHAQLVRYHVAERGLAEARRTEDQHMVQCAAPFAGRLDVDLQLLAHRLLAEVLGEAARTDRCLQRL